VKKRPIGGGVGRYIVEGEKDWIAGGKKEYNVRCSSVRISMGFL